MIDGTDHSPNRWIKKAGTWNIEGWRIDTVTIFRLKLSSGTTVRLTEMTHCLVKCCSINTKCLHSKNRRTETMLEIKTPTRTLIKTWAHKGNITCNNIGGVPQALLLFHISVQGCPHFWPYSITWTRVEDHALLKRRALPMTEELPARSSPFRTSLTGQSKDVMNLFHSIHTDFKHFSGTG